MKSNEEKQKKYNANRRKKNCFFQTSDFSINILKLLSVLNDDYHREIFKRISGNNDMINSKARRMLYSIKKCS